MFIVVEDELRFMWDSKCRVTSLRRRTGESHHHHRPLLTHLFISARVYSRIGDRMQHTGALCRRVACDHAISTTSSPENKLVLESASLQAMTRSEWCHDKCRDNAISLLCDPVANVQSAQLNMPWGSHRSVCRLSVSSGTRFRHTPSACSSRISSSVS
jgi:hypothetical protein